MENDEINRAIEKLEIRVETKCSSTVFWSVTTVTVGVLICLFGTLFTNQGCLSEDVASIKTTLKQSEKTSIEQTKVLNGIAQTQTNLSITVGIMAKSVERTASDMQELTKEVRDCENISSDVVARIAREQISWDKERAKRVN